VLSHGLVLGRRSCRSRSEAAAKASQDSEAKATQDIA